MEKLIWIIVAFVGFGLGWWTGHAIKRVFNGLESRIAVLEARQQTLVPTNGTVHYYYYSSFTNLVERH